MREDGALERAKIPDGPVSVLTRMDDVFGKHSRHGPAAVERAAAACDYFDLAALGVLLRELPELVTRRDEADLLASYLLLGRDDMLYAAFEHSFATRPDDYELVG